MRFPRTALVLFAMMPVASYAEVDLAKANLYTGAEKNSSWESVLSDMVGKEYRGQAENPVGLGGPTLQLTIKVVSPRKILMTENYIYPQTGVVAAQGKPRVLEFDGNLAQAPVALYDKTEGFSKLEALCHGISCRGIPSAPAPANGLTYSGTQRTSQTMIFHPEEILLAMVLDGVLSGELPAPMKNGAPLSGFAGQPLPNSFAVGSEHIRFDVVGVGRIVLKKVNDVSNPAAVSGALNAKPVAAVGSEVPVNSGSEAAAAR